MKTPLVVTEISEIWAEIHDATGRRVCAIYDDNAVEDARDLVNAVNERAALKERIAHLEELIKKWR